MSKTASHPHPHSHPHSCCRYSGGTHNPDATASAFFPWPEESERTLERPNHACRRYSDGTSGEGREFFRIRICVPTFKRPDLLARCLDALAGALPPPDAALALLVVDNDRDNSAAPVFAQKAGAFPFPVRMVCEPEKGLARARNRFMDIAAAGGDTHILWVDDDMILPPNYLRDLFGEMRRRRADAIRGRVRFEYEGGAAEPSRRVVWRARRPMLAGNGVLVSEKIFRRWGLRNDARFMRGFEDGDFFYRAHLRGARLFLVERPLAVERRPDSRRRDGDGLDFFTGMAAGNVFIRRFRGGRLRALGYVLFRAVPLCLQALANLLLAPLGGKRKLRKAAGRIARVRGLFRGLRVTPEEFFGE